MENVGLVDILGIHLIAVMIAMMISNQVYDLRGNFMLLCPICNYPLDSDGHCWNCGYWIETHPFDPVEPGSDSGENRY